jgi:hypothetical protein
LASQNIDHSKHLLSCQELAFIDDICYWDLEKSVKHNFQAKILLAQQQIGLAK